MSITEERLNEIQARVDAATDGPWEKCGRGIDGGPFAGNEVVTLRVDCMSYCYGGTGLGVESPADQELIANAPTDLADLLAEVHRLNRAARQALATVCEKDAEVHRLRGELARQERVAVSEEMRLRRKKAALLIELDATYRKHGEAGIEQHHLNAAKADLEAALGGGDDE